MTSFSRLSIAPTNGVRLGTGVGSTHGAMPPTSSVLAASFVPPTEKMTTFQDRFAVTA